MSRNQKSAGGSGSSSASTGGYGGGQSKYQKQMKGGKAPASTRLQGQSERVHSGRKENVDRAQIRRDGDEIDLKFGFERMKNGVPDRMGWLLNYLVTSMNDESGNEKSALDLYFVDREGGNFKATDQLGSRPVTPSFSCCLNESTFNTSPSISKSNVSR